MKKDYSTWEMDNHDVMKYLIRQKFEQCEEFRALLSENKGKTLAEATGSRLWGTGMSPFLSQNTAPDYWPGKNLLGAILTELANELPDEPMDENRESSSENEHENEHVKNKDEDDEDDNDEYEDAHQEDIATQAEELYPDMPAASQTIHNSVMSLTTEADCVPRKTVLCRGQRRAVTPLKGARNLRKTSTSTNRKRHSKPSTLVPPAQNVDIRTVLKQAGASSKRKPSGSPDDKDMNSTHLIKRQSEEQKEGT